MPVNTGSKNHVNSVECMYDSCRDDLIISNMQCKRSHNSQDMISLED